MTTREIARELAQIISDRDVKILKLEANVKKLQRKLDIAKKGLKCWLDEGRYAGRFVAADTLTEIEKD
jgi:hypothetical protein